jgi:hypothetical protein
VEQEELVARVAMVETVLPVLTMLVAQAGSVELAALVAALLDPRCKQAVW